MQKQKTFKKVFWQDIRDKVNKVNPTLTEIIDELSPGKELPLFVATYPYGHEIVRKGKFYVPNPQGRWVPVDDPSAPPELQSLLGYNLKSHPINLSLKNHIEISLTLPDRLVSYYYGIVPLGSPVGLWHMLNPNHCMQPAFLADITSGAKSLFMLPKISESISFKRLCKDFELNCEKPRNNLEHCNVFRALSSSPHFNEDWYTELLFFSKPWFDYLHDNKWVYFHRYFLEHAWKGSEYLRNKPVWDLIYSVIKQRLDLKVSSYIDSYAKDIIAIGVGGTPGFIPAIDNSAGPVQSFQQAFIDSYRLKHFPIIMQPEIRGPNDSSYIYTSLQCPTTLEFAVKQSLCASTIAEQYEVKSLLNKYIRSLLTMDLNIRNTPYYYQLKETSFDFFHTKPEHYTDIFDCSQIPAADARFTPSFNEHSFKGGFPRNSSFFNGCIRIGKK